jgi:translation initiation factor 4G
VEGEQEKERAEKERAEKEQAEKERAEKEQAEKERIENQRVEKEKADEAERLEKERIEQERVESERSEKERLDKEKAEQESAQKEADKNHLSTPATSTPSSPLASPRLAAGLPPKPVVAKPASLDLKDDSAPGTPTASATALSAARPIEDLSSIIYPGSLKSPNAVLNVDAKPGKYRYDRDFLMQFMNVCREKPENLPNLEEIGLEADSTSGFGSSRGGARGSRSSIGAGRQPPAGLGIGNLGGRNFPQGQGMGTFGMGQFGAAGVRGTTSEERYNRSLTPGTRAGGMIRTPSSGGGLPPMHGLPPMTQSTSRGGVNRSQRGTKRLPNDSRSNYQNEPEAAPLVVSQNSWVKSFGQGESEGTPAFTERKVKSLLNKLTAEKFDSISAQIVEWANKSVNETDGMTLKLVIKQIFEKATDEAHWSSMYARLCQLLLDKTDPAISEIVDGKPASGGILFRKYLVGRCQLDFEAGWKAREDAANAAAAKSAEDKAELAKHQEKEGDAAMLSDEYYAAQKAKRRGLGLVQLIGELFKLGMLGKGVIRTCFQKLLVNVTDPDEEDIESTVKLLTTVGKLYEENSQENMAALFERLDIVLKGENTSSRVKFMLMVSDHVSLADDRM